MANRQERRSRGRPTGRRIVAWTEHDRNLHVRSLLGLKAAYAVLGPVCVVGCTQPVAGDGRVASIANPIAYGAVDTTHTAVVSVLAPVGTAQLEECSGSVVMVSGGDGYVLTAAHCCNTHTPTLVVVSNDYSIGEQYISGGTPAPPVYPVIAGSVWYDALYSQDGQQDHDFCMLRFSGAPGGTATLKLPSTTDGLVVGSPIEHVGFGVTDSNSSNSQRRAGSDAVGQGLTSLVVEFTQGPSNDGGDSPGTCEGDSGGPSLFPATGAQSQQVVVAVQSFGSAAPCAEVTLGVASRVSSAMGPGGFISSYLASAPTGVEAGGSPVAARAFGGRWALIALAAGLVGIGAGPGRRRRKSTPIECRRRCRPR